MLPLINEVKMSTKKLLSKFIPSIWQGYRERSRIKAKHLRNLNKLRKGEDVFADFGENEEYTLGHWAGTRHSQTLEEIRSEGTVQSDMSYRIPSDQSRERIEELTQSTIKRIRVKNVISFVSILLFSLLLLAVVSGIGAAVATYITC